MRASMADLMFLIGHHLHKFGRWLQAHADTILRKEMSK